ncbi:MAG: bifunctional folylpolyglutamate synthase/dihydrofolate synthase [Firmicutes bacterium]|nr:bifunctional folylpolyglutamate synthase/dihydrofolate synthase [Bacillota bacterium]
MAADIIERIHNLDRFGSVLGLERLQELLRRLGDPQKELKCIHVAGTNGKGSVCRFLEQGLTGCGYRVGLYISPYIEVFNERIQCGGRYITDGELEKYGSRVLDEMKAMTDEGLASPTEFEAVMAIAFAFFAAQKPDFVVLETGLGGIGDATNVIRDPLACAITTISFDHRDVLGDTLEEIAENKAGIIKDGAPVITNVKEHGPAAVIARKAYAEGCRLYDVSRIRCRVDWETPVSQQVSMMLWETDYSEIEIAMVGEHQAENLKTALAVLEVLRRERIVRIERSALYEGLRTAYQPARFEVVAGRERWTGGEKKGPAVILDGAHNEAGAKALKETVNRFFAGERILLVLGILRDKEVDAILEQMTDITGEIITTAPDSPRKLGADELADRLRSRGIEPLAVAETPEECVRAAMERKSEYDAVLFAGSLYLVGAVRRLLRDGQ